MEAGRPRRLRARLDRPARPDYFGDKLAGIPDEARPDDTRFPRAFEVSIRGGHDPELAGWKKARRASRAGAVTVNALENPSPVQLLDDLIAHATPTGMRAVQGGAECRWVHGATTAGNLGAGRRTPGDRLTCPIGRLRGRLAHPRHDRSRPPLLLRARRPAAARLSRFASRASRSATPCTATSASPNSTSATGPAPPSRSPGARATASSARSCTTTATAGRVRARHDRARGPDGRARRRDRVERQRRVTTASRRTRDEARRPPRAPREDRLARSRHRRARSASSTSRGSSPRCAPLGFPRDEGVYFRAAPRTTGAGSTALRLTPSEAFKQRRHRLVLERQPRAPAAR